MGILVSIIAYLYLKEQKSILDQTIFAQIKQYNFDFKNKNLSIDIIPNNKTKKTLHLYHTQNEIYALFPISQNKNKLLKVIYPIKLYKKEIDKITKKILIIYIFILLFLFLFSLIYSFYALHPMKKALTLMDEFFNDIVHDLNTPIASILLNSKYLNKINPNDEIKKIELSAKRISSLYKNFEQINTEFKEDYNESIDLYQLIQDRIKYHQQIYNDIDFILEDINFKTYLPKESLIRILDNIISNACKYNKPKGKVKISFKNNQLIIQDTGIGMAQPDKIFERYYKETSRGIGIGMNVVKKLCDKLGIEIQVSSKINIGTTIFLKFNDS